MNDTIKKLDEEFEEKFKCIQGDCAGGGHTYPTEDEPEGGQCQFCAEYIFPIKAYIHHRDAVIIEAVREKIENMKEEHPFCYDGCPEDGSTCSVIAKNELINDILSTLK